MQIAHKTTLCRFHREYGTQRSSRLTFFEEKLGFREAFRGNKFTVHGTKHEPLALDAYRKLSSHTVQAGIGALTLGQDPSEDWLAASPDGLIQDVAPGGFCNTCVPSAV